MTIQKQFDFSDLKFEFDLSKANYQIDILQNRLLQTYLRADSRFRRAFSQNYTYEFLQFLKDKARLREPVHLSVIGATRSGKSYSSITIAGFQMACYKKYFGIDFICGNAYEFIEKLKQMPQERLKDTTFLIDEEKQAVYGVGSVARKMKILDVQNIIAINNISTIMLNPNTWANKNSGYGLRSFGRCFETKTVRFMLYNLQAGGKQSELPLGCVYLPRFIEFFPKEYALDLEKKYLDKKLKWVAEEQMGRGDILAEIKRKSAENFMKDKQYLTLKTKDEKITYVSQKMGSEWSKGEIDEIFQITKLLGKGINLEE